MKKSTLILSVFCAALGLSACTGAPASTANETNPYLGRTITESGAEAGVYTNAHMGKGAAGDVGND